MMRAAVLDDPGTALRLETILKPQPKAGEVLLRVRACGVCATDLHVIKGKVGFPTPCVLGHEVSGVVEAVGDGVVTCAPGEAVVAAFLMPCGFCRSCARGRDDLCETFFGLNRVRGTLYDGTTRLYRTDGTPLAMYSMGGLAEYAVVPATAVFPVPVGLDLDAAAVLGCAVLTAYGAVAHGAPEQALAMVCEGGTMVAVGIADGAATAAVGITHVVRRSIRLVGSYGGRTRTDMPALIRLIDAGAITVDAQIGTRVPLEDAGQVYEALDHGEVVGRALVLP
jgi:S-(hydroxymethyl)glutathione dehydrogenase/alcohol dehydrogenase